MTENFNTHDSFYLAVGKNNFSPEELGGKKMQSFLSVTLKTHSSLTAPEFPSCAKVCVCDPLWLEEMCWNT